MCCTASRWRIPITVPPLKSFSSGGGRQGRQRVVRRPVGHSPLEAFTIEAGSTQDFIPLATPR